MKKLNDKANAILARLGINARVAMVVFCMLVIFGVFAVVVTKGIEGIAFAILAILALGIGGRVIAPPPPEEIALATGAWLNQTFNGMLRERLSVFRSLYYDRYPTGDPEQWYYELRWGWHAWGQNGHTIVTIFVRKATSAILSADILTAERRTLQGVLDDDVANGLVPLVAHVQMVPGVSTLSLLDIRDTPEYVHLDFVWVSDQATADFVHRHGIKPAGGEGGADDLDF